MSLTPQALKERVWGPFPTLRTILETKAIPEHYYGASSASKNIFDQLQNFLKIAILVKENASAIAETGDKGIPSELASSRSSSSTSSIQVTNDNFSRWH